MHKKLEELLIYHNATGVTSIIVVSVILMIIHNVPKRKRERESFLSSLSFTEQEAIGVLKSDDETGLSCSLNVAISEEWLQSQRCAFQLVVITKQH